MFEQIKKHTVAILLSAGFTLLSLQVYANEQQVAMNSQTADTPKTLLETTPVGQDTDVRADVYEGIEVIVNVNQASADELATLLVGIGQNKAQAIVDYREANGAFQSAQDLVAVKGIGQATVEKNKSRLLFE